MSAPKIIKRYANRKLYDTERSCYVTLDDIAVMIKAGDEINVIDNKSGEDLTSVTLAQIIFEAEKKKNFMPLGLLRDLIQEKGDLLGDAYRDSVEKVQAHGQQFKDTADKLREGFGETLRKGEEGARGQIASAKDLVTSSQKALDELQHDLENKVRSGAGVVGREFDQIRKRLSELEARLTNKSE